MSSIESTPENDRFARLAGLVARAAERLPGADAPCLAYARVRSGGRERDLLFGPRASLEAEPLVLDMKNAPLARLLYEIEIGEPYEIDVAERTVEGTLLDRAMLVVDRDVLVRIEDDAGVHRRSDSGDDSFARRGLDTGLSPDRGHHASFGFDVQLDPTQRAAVESDREGAMLVVGEAGAGKTTVALRRLVRLAGLGSTQARPFRGLYVVPTPGLARWVETAIERSRAEGIEVVAFDDLAIALARKAFPKLARRIARDAPAPVARIKRHPALDGSLARLVELRPVAAAEEERRGHETREDLLHLFGDRALLEAMLADAGDLRRADVDAVIERTRAQFRERSEDAFADVVDATKLQTLDGRSLDAGTPEELAGRVDVEDLAVVFEIARLRELRAGWAEPRLGAYDVVVIDEAQELAPIELRLLRRLLADHGALVVAGDEAQRTESGVGFEGFEATLRELRARDPQRIRLETSYRCPAEVTDFARPLRDGSPARLVAGAHAIVARGFAADLHRAMSAAAFVRSVRERDAHATIALVTRERASAFRLAMALGDTLDASLAIDGRFDFRRTVFVATVADVRGLEFDFVLLVDLEASEYPAEEFARRALYLGATRACVALSLAWVGARTAWIDDVESGA